MYVSKTKSHDTVFLEPGGTYQWHVTVGREKVSGHFPPEISWFIDIVNNIQFSLACGFGCTEHE